MAKYKVKTLYLGGLGNKIFRSGDTVTEKNFPKGNAEKLAKSGAIELIEEKPKSQPKKKTSTKKDTKK